MKSLETTWEKLQDLQSQTVSEQLVKIQNISGEKAELTTSINVVQIHDSKMNEKTAATCKAVFTFLNTT